MATGTEREGKHSKYAEDETPGGKKLGGKNLIILSFVRESQCRAKQYKIKSRKVRHPCGGIRIAGRSHHDYRVGHGESADKRKQGRAGRYQTQDRGGTAIGAVSGWRRGLQQTQT
ncbi:MAG TPA: hypothetical protein VMV34_09370 [Terriglobia bacterium]|nr:hypothetical protein [Terriglobia bacterium]